MTEWSWVLDIRYINCVTSNPVEREHNIVNSKSNFNTVGLNLQTYIYGTVYLIDDVQSVDIPLDGSPHPKTETQNPYPLETEM